MFVFTVCFGVSFGVVVLLFLFLFLLFYICVYLVVGTTGIGPPAGVSVCVCAGVCVIVLFRHSQDLLCFVISVDTVLPILLFNVICLEMRDRLLKLTAD